MRKSVLEDEGEDEGTAFTAVASTMPTRVIVGFTTNTTTAAVASTTASVTVATSGDDDNDDDDSNNRSSSTAVWCAGNRAAAKPSTFKGKERKGSVALVVVITAAAELSVHAHCRSQAASSTG